MLTFYSRILVAYDGSELSKKALNMAIVLAKQDKRVEVHVVYVVQTVTSFDYVVASLSDREHENARKLLKEAEERLKEIPDNRTKAVLFEGDPAEMILEYARANDCDLIVMGSRGLSGIQELFLGSVSHRVVQHAHCPVMVVK